MNTPHSIAGYCRISVDDELDRDNVSIENQKAIIADFVKHQFPDSALTFYEDRDRSGYTFDQREGYQTMRRELMNHTYDILVIKDFSRFSRRNSRGLVELEDLRDAGVRIISIGDGIDYPRGDDWMKIQFQFLINEMPVTDASRKVKSVIKRRQEEGEWLCAAPYGYCINKQRVFEIIPTEAEIVRKIFDLYNQEGWGYQRIANYLTAEGIPTPRMSEQMRKEAEGITCRREVKAAWAITTIQSILENDFYIGTFRQAKYTRAKINGKDLKQGADKHIVIENHHQPILDYRTFAITRENLAKRSTSHYRGVKKYDNFYSGFLFCGDCGSPMFAMSRQDLKEAYRCGTYHKQGRAGCTSHHIRTDCLDDVLKQYIRMVMENSSDMLERLNADLAREKEQVEETEVSAERLGELLEELHEELKATKRQRIRDLMKHPEQEELLEATYDEMEEELQRKIEGLNRQMEMLADRRNTILQMNRAAKTVMDVFRDILEKEKLDRHDLELVIRRILVFEDHIEVELKADVDALLRAGNVGEAVENAPEVAEPAPVTLVQESAKRPDKVLDVQVSHRHNVINEGDPLEIYTDREGEVIFKKYSPIGELAQFAAQYAETLHKTCGLSVVICDRDAVITCAGVPKREYTDRKLTPEAESLMENRQLYTAGDGEPVAVVEGGLPIGCLMPIITEGDITGCVASLRGGDGDGRAVPAELEAKLIQTAAGFLGKQLEA